MTFPLSVPYMPMEAFTNEELPKGEGWQYEPKWDGFRCVAFKDGKHVELQSKAGKLLTRYFPEVVETLRALPARRFVLDGEIVIQQDGTLNFDSLLQRIHPAASRVAKLSAETPATLVVFDLLAEGRAVLAERPLTERRAALERFAKENFKKRSGIALSPATDRYAETKEWLKRAGSALDGLIAKRVDEPYHSGERQGMQKLKFKKTADCVVGGFRYGKGGLVGSLLLGLYDDEGLLHHVGFTSSIARKDKAALTARLEKLRGGKGFTGRAPGGPSRWATAESTKWEPLRPKLVCEVEYDHFTGDRFRHGTKFLRWRSDKPASRCSIAQVERENSAALLLH